jgi:hypothetical protein
MEQHAKSDFVLDDGVQNQVVILEEELKAASRTQAKAIRDKLNSLNKDKDKLRNSIDKIEEKIHNLESKIQKLNDQIWKVSLKVSVIGHDLENEYWYFKDDLSRIYIKEIKTNTWKYYNDEESVQQLEESLITKGIREKKLREGLRKLRGKLKLRKRKDGRSDEKPKSEAFEADQSEKVYSLGEKPIKNDNEDYQMEEEKHEDINEQVSIERDGLDAAMADEGNQSEEEIEWEKALDRSINYSIKKSEFGTRSGRGKAKKFENLSLECIIEKLIDNEEEYTEAAATLNKVWAPFSYAEKIKKEIINAKNEKEIVDALITLEEGYSNPMSFRRLEEYNLRNLELEAEAQKDENGVIIVDNKIIEGDMVFYRNNRKIKKFW